MEQNAEIIAKAINGTLAIVEQERERKIIEKRFGLDGHKETLEQIGETLSVTRERVRQLEKVILVRLRISAKEGKSPSSFLPKNSSSETLPSLDAFLALTTSLTNYMVAPPPLSKEPQFLF